MGAPEETLAEHSPSEHSVELFLVGLEYAGPARSDDWLQTSQHVTHDPRGMSGPPAMDLLMASSPDSLHGRHAPFPAERPDGGRDEEEGATVDEHGNGHRLVAIAFERLQLIELKRAGEFRSAQAIAVEGFGMERQPAESPLDGAPRHLQDACRLALSHAGSKQPQARGVQVRFLLPGVGPE